jgi:hypothetical protein
MLVYQRETQTQLESPVKRTNLFFVDVEVPPFEGNPLLNLIHPGVHIFSAMAKKHGVPVDQQNFCHFQCDEADSVRMFL